MSDYHMGGELDLASFPHLSAALAAAETTAPQALRKNLGHRLGAEKLCMAVHEHQMILGDAKSCRYLGTASDESCHTVFLRNPATSATLVAHLNIGLGDEDDFLKAVAKIAGRGGQLDMYIMGGENRLTGNGHGDTGEDVDTTLGKLSELAAQKHFLITPKVINLHGAKTESGAVIDTVNGDFFYVPHEAIDRYVLKPASNDTMRELGPIEIVYNGLQKPGQKL